MTNILNGSSPQTTPAPRNNIPSLQTNRIRPPLTFTGPHTRWRLMLFLGNDAITSLRLDISGQLTIGRADVLDGHIPGLDLGPHGAQDKGVSRRHAMISPTDEGLNIRDTGSTNGTRVNGYKLEANQPYKLADNDEIEFGQLRLSVKIVGPQAR